MKFLPVTQNRLIKLIALAFLSGAIAACATKGQTPAVAPDSHEGTKAKARQPQQMKLRLASGVYRCESGQRVEVQRDSKNANLLELNWQGNHHKLQRYDSASGLPRYEDRQNGLLWIDLPQKSVLIDANSGRPLANECKVAKS